MKPKIYFRNGYWRCYPLPPYLSRSLFEYWLPFYIKANEFCNRLNKKDKMQLAIKLLLEAATSKEKAGKSPTAAALNLGEKLLAEAKECRVAAQVLLEHQSDDYR